LGRLLLLLLQLAGVSLLLLLLLRRWLFVFLASFAYVAHV
jgi:hypothetical protein